MFRLDLDAIRDAAIEVRLVANMANATVEEQGGRRGLAKLATSQDTSRDLDPVLTELLSAAIRVCDAWNDSEGAREQMRKDIQETPLQLREDLLKHFRESEQGITDKTGR